MKYRIVLASASPRRRELLTQIGLEFEIRPAMGDGETTAVSPGLLVEELSRNKAEEVAENAAEDELVIGADTMVFLGDQAMGKPKSEEDAAQMLRSLQGNVHQVYTGFTFSRKTAGKVVSESFHEKTDVTVYPMSVEEIQAYIATKDPMDKAGAYGIQGPFARHIQGITGDYNNVVGLPVGRVYQELKKRGMV